MPEKKIVTPDADVRGHAAAARLRKRKAAEAMGIDTAFISEMVENFYARIRGDALLGPIFARHIDDWPPHLARMKSFWASVLHNSGGFSGNPMVKHIAIDGLDHAHFVHWLDLFHQTLEGMDASSKAVEHIHERARMIANSLMNGVAIHRDGLSGARNMEAF
ncbi:group III truncated hemoglobin [Sphingorhabdus sp. Alg239-R122]|uniref:group III truncated hemoglobin n=1 Tax=Sphingorhabdus sp. Alg239-R122 TaxID=2305989 RepID=UPI0013DCDFAB|nr:group III truncated hemoglobin [Sphingorhabdus sp. Alg239-R122]